MQENDFEQKKATAAPQSSGRARRKARPLENVDRLTIDYEPMAHKGLFMGVAPQVRGRYFVLRGKEMHPLVSPLNSPGMFAEIAGEDGAFGSFGVAGDVRAALAACWKRCVARDKSRRMISSITIEDLVAIYVRQKGRCALTGMPFVLPGDREDVNTRGPWSPSVDRLNNRNGYVIDNIQLVTVMANGSKSDFSAKDFHRMCAHASINMKLLGPRE